MKQRIKQAIGDISSQTLQKLWKNRKSGINHVISLNDRRIEQDNI